MCAVTKLIVTCADVEVRRRGFWRVTRGLCSCALLFFLTRASSSQRFCWNSTPWEVSRFLLIYVVKRHTKTRSAAVAEIADRTEILTG